MVKDPFIESNKFSYVTHALSISCLLVTSSLCWLSSSCVSSNKCVPRSPWRPVNVFFTTLLSVQSLPCPLVVLILWPLVMSVQCPLIFVSAIHSFHSFDNLLVPFQWLWMPLCMTASVHSACCIWWPLLSASLYPFRCSAMDRGHWSGCLLWTLRYLIVNKKVLRVVKSRFT